MIFKDLYQRFLDNPVSVALAPEVSLNYITTTTQIDGPDAVLSQLTKQNIVKKKSETILDAVEGANSLCVDVETSVEFLAGGGAYLPSLDDNFLADHVATFPTIHIVRFNSQNQIQQVRIYWDQGSLLKQVEVIGARSRGWPIRDAKEQTRMIKSAASTTPASAKSNNASADFAPKAAANDTGRPTSPGKRHIKDPYAAGSLYELLSPGAGRAEPVRAPRSAATAAPPPRDLSELFVGDDDNDDDVPPSPSKAPAPKAGAGRNFQPSRIFDDDETVAKEEAAHDALSPAKAAAPRAGGGKHFQPSRIFDDDETVAKEEGQQIAYRANPKRFDHFELGGDNSAREIKEKPARPLSKGGPQWSFEDFATPEKPRRGPRGQEIRHFDLSEDNGQDDSPPRKPRVPQPRPDAETHFSITDDPDANSSGRYIRAHANKNLDLYKNPLFDGGEDEEPLQDVSNRQSQPPLSVMQHGPNRKKDFEPHWEARDDTPPQKGAGENKKPVGADRQRALKMMEASWEAYDESPQPSKFTQPPPQRRALRNVNERSWDIYDDA